MFPLIIIGNGIASQALLYFLKKKNFPLKNICQISADNLAQPASLNNTGLISPMGIKKGISPLGDILSTSWDFFTKWEKENKPNGVYKAQHYLLATKDPLPHNHLNKLSRRFTKLDSISNIAGKELKEPLTGKIIPSYLIHPRIYLKWFKEKNKEVSLIKEMVCKVERKKQNWTLHLLNKKQITGTHLVIACGAFSKIAEDTFEKKYFSQTKIAAGSFLQFKHPSFSSYAAITLGDFNIIYRKENILLGATSDGSVLAPSLDRLQEFHRQIPLTLGDNFALPPLNQGKIISAYRHKGVKRLPFWGEMDKNLYGIHSLYKNGLLTSLPAAEQLAETLVKKY